MKIDRTNTAAVETVEGLSRRLEQYADGLAAFGVGHPFQRLESDIRIAARRLTAPQPGYLIAEAHEMLRHQSKDVRAFAQSVLDTANSAKPGAAVPEGMSLLVDALEGAMIESLHGEGFDLWAKNRGKLRNRLPENVGAIVVKMRALLAAPAPEAERAEGEAVGPFPPLPQTPFKGANGNRLFDGIHMHLYGIACSEAWAAHPAPEAHGGGKCSYCGVTFSSGGVSDNGWLFCSMDCCKFYNHPAPPAAGQADTLRNWSARMAEKEVGQYVGACSHGISGEPATGQPEGVEALAALIADDGYACTFQSMGQYRSALLRFARRLASAQQRNPPESPDGLFSAGDQTPQVQHVQVGGAP